MRTWCIQMIVIGVFFLILGSSLLMISGMGVAEQTEARGPLIFAGCFSSVAGVVVFSACSFVIGTGQDRDFDHLEINHIYKIISATKIQDNNFRVVIRYQNGAVRDVKFQEKPESRFIKIVRSEKGKKIYVRFPPSEGEPPVKEEPSETA